MTCKTAKAAVQPVRQRTQYTCMATSMMMCLQALGHEVDEDEVNKVMGARPMKGAAWEHALACAQHYGCRATLTVPSTVQQLKEWTDQGIPVMIAWNPEGREWSHASVVFDVDDDLNVYVADPNIPDTDETVRIVPKKDFYNKWYEKWPNYLVRRPAMAVSREITTDGKQVMASAKKVASLKQTARINWQRLSRGKGWKYVTPELLVHVLPVESWDHVRDRDIPDVHEVADAELTADAIPHLVESYNKMVKEHAKWVRQGWWPRPVRVEKWEVWAYHRPSKKGFRGVLDDERTALRSTENAIPKLLERKRPSWLKPDNDGPTRAAKRTTEVRKKKDKNAPVKVKVDRLRNNPAAEAAGARKPTRGHRRKERGRNVERGHSRKDKHKGRRQERQSAASPSRVALRHVHSRTLDLSGMDMEDALDLVMENVGIPRSDYSWKRGEIKRRVMGDLAADGSQQALIRGEILFSRGAFVEDRNIKEFLNQFPRGEAALKHRFTQSVLTNRSDLGRDIRKRIQRSPKQFLGTLFDDYQEAEEYEPLEVTVAPAEFSRQVRVDARWGKLISPATVEVNFSAKKLPPVGEGVFSIMSNTELNRWIEGWASYAPENFYMDGETGMNSNQLFRHYREQWRGLSPRRQAEKYKSLQRYVR